MPRPCAPLLALLFAAAMIFSASPSSASLFDPWFGSAFQTIPFTGVGDLAAVADLNGDGRGDLIGTKGVLLAQANGTFAQSQALTGNTGVPVVMDFDGDHDVDLIWSSAYPETTLSVYRGNGAGLFSQLKLGVGPNQRDCAVGDLNEDGFLDIVALVSNSTVTVLLGTSNPVSYQRRVVTTGAVPRGIGIADVNADGRLDFVTSCSQNGSSGYISIHLGDGAGSFTRVDVPAGVVGQRVFLHDFTGDGTIDVALKDDIQSVSLLAGHGDGTFATPVLFGQISRLEAADLYVDNDWEFVALPLMSTSSIPLTSRPRLKVFDAGALADVSVPEAFSGPLVCGDMDGDGDPDVLINSPGLIHVFLNGGPGQWDHPQFQWLPLHSAYQGGWCFTDINGDGWTDIAAGGAEGLDVAYALPGGGFDIALDPTGTAFPGTVSTAAFGPLSMNSDGYEDLILPTVTNNVRTIRVAWTGAGAPSYSNDVAFPAYRIATGDFTGDGNDDVAGLVRETISGQYLVSVLPGDGGNGFSTEIRSPATLDQDDNLSPIAAGDLNRDGILDLVTGRGAHLGLGDGHFGTLIAFETPPSVDYKDLLLTDLDWDGILDVVGGVSSGPTVTARLGRGDGSFLFRSILTGYPYTPLAAGDFDGDGYAELALGCAPTYVFRGNSNAVFNLEGVYGGTFNAVAFADANGDGVRDILSTHSYLPNLKPIVDTYPPVAHVGHPNGGKLVAAEQPVTIDWTSKDGVGVQKVDLYLVREPGGQVVPIQEGLPTNGTLEWTPGMANAGLAKIRVVATDLSGNQAMDESDAAFPIAMPPVGVPDTTVANLKLALRVSPNPFKGRGRVELDLPGPTPVRMTVHDVSGRLVEVLEDEFVATARHSQEWRASGFAPGVYFVRLDTRFGALTKRIVLFP